MPGADRAPGRKGPGPGPASRGAGVVAWLKWALLLLVACTLSFVVSLFVIGPRVHPPAERTDTGSPGGTGAFAPDQRPTAPSSSEPPVAITPAPGNSGRAEDRSLDRGPGVPPRASAPAPEAQRPADEGQQALPPGNEPPAAPEPTGGEPSVRIVPAPRRSVLPRDNSVTVIPMPRAPEPGGSVSRPGASGTDESGAVAPSPSPSGEGTEMVLTPTTPVNRKLLWRVLVGAPQTQAESERLAAELKRNGFSARVVTEGSLHSVQAGAFQSRENAEKLASRLGAKGFSATLSGGPDE